MSQVEKRQDAEAKPKAWPGSDPVEDGRKGGSANTRRMGERLDVLRWQLLGHAPEAIEGLARVVREEGNPRLTPAATAILDRIGLGPSSSVDVQVEGSERLALLITQLDKEEVLQGNEAEQPAELESGEVDGT